MAPQLLCPACQAVTPKGHLQCCRAAMQPLPAMEAHIALLLTVQQLVTDAQRQMQSRTAEELQHLQEIEAAAAAQAEYAISDPMFDLFDRPGPDGKKDGTITAEE